MADIFDVMPSAFDIWRDCFISDDAAEVLECVEHYQTLESNDTAERCFTEDPKCKPVMVSLLRCTSFGKVFIVVKAFLSRVYVFT